MFRLYSTTRGRRRAKLCVVGVLSLLCVFPFLELQLLHSFSHHPSSFSSIPHPYSSCPSSFSLHPSQFCIQGCQNTCFPRIHNLCFYSSQVKICEDTIERKSIKNRDILDFEGWNGALKQRPEPLSIMRFHGERLTLPVVRSACPGQKKWTSGLAMVADQRYLPYGKPNPHHEAEKLIPALLMRQTSRLSSSRLYWFSTKQDLSVWATGFLKAVSMKLEVQFLDLPEQHEAAVCFEDAVVLSAPTNLWYIPDESSNKWLRDLVLQHCSISPENSSWPLKSASILDRQGGKRHIANKQLVAEVLQRVFNVSVKQRFSGIGSFCDQVQAVVEDDLLIVPHGSQNTNLIFARPGTIVIEVFPHLYYTEALRNYTHAAGLQVYAVLGHIPHNKILSRIFSLLGWDFCYHHLRWCKNYSRQQPIYVDTFELEKLLMNIGKNYYSGSQPLAT